MPYFHVGARSVQRARANCVPLVCKSRAIICAPNSSSVLSVPAVASTSLRNTRIFDNPSGAASNAAYFSTCKPTGDKSDASELSMEFPDRRITSGLGSVFEPKSVAVVGATDRAGSVGRTLVNNLIISNKMGGGKYQIYPVNPTRKTVMGLDCFASIEAIPHGVDMAVIVTPASTCVDVMRQCGKKGVKAAVVISAGFKEAGPKGVALENELIQIARDSGIRVIGPNCVGVMNPNFGLNATFAATMGIPGNVAFISQSGAMCTAVLDWSLKEKIGFSAFISVGSMADVNWGDLIDYLGSDPSTNAILIYMESVGDAAGFLSAAKEVGLTKPIIVIKAGKSEAAAAAAASHTGSLAGSYKSFEAAMKRVGVMTADTIQELFNSALVLGKQPRPRGPNLMIVTNAGGPAVLATDAAVTSGAMLSPVSKDTLSKLNDFLPAAWSHSNPIDILGDANAELYARTLEIVLQDSNADGVLVALSPQDVTDPTATAKALVDAVSKMKNNDKPILAAWMGGETVEEGFKLLSQAGIPTFSNPDEAASTFGRLWKQVEAMEELYVDHKTSNEVDIVSKESREKSLKVLERATSEGRNLLTEAESKEILSAYGIGIVKTIVAQSSADALKAAKEIGGDIFALKLNSKTLTHKADVGGVKLNLSMGDIESAYKAIQDSVVSLHGKEHFQGCTVQPMIRLDKGIELILGSTVDPQFGPLMMFGSGGTMVEVFKDTALGVPPVDDNLADQLIKQTNIYKALKGGHGKRFEGVDLEKLKLMLSRFSNMIVDLSDHITECDINPLLAMKNDFIALDARFALKPKDSTPVKLSVRSYPIAYVSSASLSKPNDTVIRPITSNDKPMFAKFNQKNGIKVERDVTIKTCHPDYDRRITMVAVKDGDIIGMFDVERPPPNHLSRHQAHVKISLPKDVQSSSLSQAFMDSIINIGKSEGIKELRCAAKNDNAHVMKLLEGQNWTKAVVRGDATLFTTKL